MRNLPDLPTFPPEPDGSAHPITVALSAARMRDDRLDADVAERWCRAAWGHGTAEQRGPFASDEERMRDAREAFLRW